MVCESMRKVIVLVILLGAAFTPSSRASGLEVQSWKCDADTKVLSLKLVNTSEKTIIAYSLGIILKYADGTTDALQDGKPSSWRGTDEVWSLIYAEMAKGTPDEEFAERNGIGFAPGTTRYDVLQGQTKDVVDVKTVVGAVIYANYTAETSNEEAFKSLIGWRKGELQAMQKVNEIIKRVLDDPSITNPLAQVKTELAQLALTATGKSDSAKEMQFRNAISNLNNAERAKQNEADCLRKYSEDLDKRIQLTLPHTEITPQIVSPATKQTAN